jgi:hypothetical protein
MLLSHLGRRSGFCSSTLGSVLVLLLAASPISANVVYQYVGNNFDTIIDGTAPAGTYTTDMSVMGSFELTAPLAPNLAVGSTGTITADILSFSFSDGRSTLTESTPNIGSNGILSFEVSTDALGAIVGWAIAIGAGDAGVSPPGLLIETSSDFTNFDSGEIHESGGMDIGSITNSPGTWTLVPEPGTGSLLALGLGLAMRRRMQPGVLLG